MYPAVTLPLGKRFSHSARIVSTAAFLASRPLIYATCDSGFCLLLTMLLPECGGTCRRCCTAPRVAGYVRRTCPLLRRFRSRCRLAASKGGGNVNLSSKIAVGGLAIATLFFTAWSVRAGRVEAYEMALIAECKKTGTTAQTKTPASDEHGPWEQYADAPPLPPGFVLDSPIKPPVCDAATLIELGDTTGTQRQIVDAHWATSAAKDQPAFFASLIAGLSLIPWAWYFLLRRLAELRSALSGKAPNG